MNLLQDAHTDDDVWNRVRFLSIEDLEYLIQATRGVAHILSSAQRNLDIIESELAYRRGEY